MNSDDLPYTSNTSILYNIKRLLTNDSSQPKALSSPFPFAEQSISKVRTIQPSPVGNDLPFLKKLTSQARSPSFRPAQPQASKSKAPSWLNPDSHPIAKLVCKLAKASLKLLCPIYRCSLSVAPPS